MATLGRREVGEKPGAGSSLGPSVPRLQESRAVCSHGAVSERKRGTAWEQMGGGEGSVNFLTSSYVSACALTRGQGRRTRRAHALVLTRTQ